MNAIYEDGKLLFQSYANANKIFGLSKFYHEATDSEIELFAKNESIAIDVEWFKSKTNSVIRKQITLLQKSGLLKAADTKKIRKSASAFNLKINLDAADKIVFPTDKGMCKDILTFLNEQYFNGVITGRAYRTNSKREV